MINCFAHLLKLIMISPHMHKLQLFAQETLIKPNSADHSCDWHGSSQMTKN